jgi:hypothetical protein
MQLNVIARIENLCAPIRQEMEARKISHLAVLNACNSHLGKLKSEQTGDDKRGDMKVSQKKDTAKLTVKPGAVTFIDNYNVVAMFIAWNDAIQKAHNIARMETVSIPEVFSEWLVFAKVKEEAIETTTIETTTQ